MISAEILERWRQEMNFEAEGLVGQSTPYDWPEISPPPHSPEAEATINAVEFNNAQPINSMDSIQEGAGASKRHSPSRRGKGGTSPSQQSKGQLLFLVLLVTLSM